MCPTTSRIRLISPGPKYRATTRLASGSNWIGSRLTCMAPPAGGTRGERNPTPFHQFNTRLLWQVVPRLGRRRASRIPVRLCRGRPTSSGVCHPRDRVAARRLGRHGEMGAGSPPTASTWLSFGGRTFATSGTFPGARLSAHLPPGDTNGGLTRVHSVDSSRRRRGEDVAPSAISLEWVPDLLRKLRICESTPDLIGASRVGRSWRTSRRAAAGPRLAFRESVGKLSDRGAVEAGVVVKPPAAGDECHRLPVAPTVVEASEFGFLVPPGGRRAAQHGRGRQRTLATPGSGQGKRAHLPRNSRRTCSRNVSSQPARSRLFLMPVLAFAFFNMASAILRTKDMFSGACPSRSR